MERVHEGVGRSAQPGVESQRRVHLSPRYRGHNYRRGWGGVVVLPGRAHFWRRQFYVWSAAFHSGSGRFSRGGEGSVLWRGGGQDRFWLTEINRQSCIC